MVKEVTTTEELAQQDCLQKVQPECLYAAEPSGNHNGFRDPAFADNKTLPIHRWTPWIAGYSAHFVDDVIDMFGHRSRVAQSPIVVLDPFAGVGTTLVQAMLQRCSTIGFEINPYAALASHVKSRAPFLGLGELHRVIRSLQAGCDSWRSLRLRPSSKPPGGFHSRIPFFSPSIEHQVLCALDFINGIEASDIRDLFRVAFGSVMVSFSNYSYEPSLGTRPGAGKPLIEDAFVGEVLFNKISQMAEDVEWVQSKFGDQIVGSNHRVFNVDFLGEGPKLLSENSIDLMITSPPYMNNYHYLRNTRPQLYWLSLVYGNADTKSLEETNFGKFWQTVRTSPPIQPRFNHPGLLELIGLLQAASVEKGPYGGPGWANYVTAYFNDATRFLSNLYCSLRPGGVGVIVVGNSIIQGIEFKVDVQLGELAENVGFVLEEVRTIRQKRVGASITQSTVRRGERSRAVLYESAVIIRKGSMHR